jgi:phenylacetate-coenzyme A ligase PaaK-like adenylate-forming protein
MIAASRHRRLGRDAEARARAYATTPDLAARLDIQLRAFNAEWQRIAVDVPFYRRLVLDGRLPREFRSWREVIDRVPPLTRATVQRDGPGRASDRKPADAARTTGGSTAEPITIPVWHSEIAETTPNVWMARRWYGVEPGSRLFMIWGHKHLLGSGLRGWLNGMQRRIFDAALGYHRFSAYDLRAERLRVAADEMLRCRPDYVMGYSVALDRFARANADRGPALRALGIKVVVAAAEGFPASDSEARLGDLFGAPVAMEYGSVETGLIAHTHPEGGYRAFWQQYFLEAESQGEGRPARLRVTSLYPRALPLVRYEIGDEIELDADPCGLGVERFRRVVGRCNDYLPLTGGALIHSEAVAHVVAGHPSVDGYQVVSRGADIHLRVAARELDPATEASIRERLGRVHKELEHIRIERVDTLRQTAAGKTRTVVTS